ncbi:MAG: ABC transporter ATP-binding protein [Lachnospiraceae bacterium]
MLKVKGLKIAYKGVQVINGIDFSVSENQFTVLIGANGAGKTSIIKAIMGLIKPAEGEILYNDIDLNKVKPYKMTSLGLSLCPEGRQLFPDMTVEENLEMGAYSRKDKSSIKQDISEMYEKFPRLSDRRIQKAKTLSGGEQELLAIARSLIAKPRLLLLDEPSWGLAPLMIEEVMMTIKNVKETSDTTILLVEQNARIALKYADYAYVLDVGDVVMEGTGQELINDDKVKEVYLGA